MKIEHIIVSRFNVEEVIKEINRRLDGSGKSVFFTPTSILKGALEIHTEEAEKPQPQGKIKSEYTGVHREKPTQRWRASISVNGERKSLGRFDTEEEAAIAYDMEKLKHLGPKAKTNFKYRLKFWYDEEKGTEIDYEVIK